MKSQRFDFNFFVIGAGSAGLSAAYLANAMGGKVALVERQRMGGDCLHTGCVPSKTFLAEAEAIAQATNKGLMNPLLSKDELFQRSMLRVKEVIHQLSPHDSIERYTQMGVKCFQGEALVHSANEVEVNGKKYRTRRLILALGAHPNIPSVPGLNEIPYFTSDTIWQIKSLPSKLLVFGGGAIGSELAQAFARSGSAVTQVERHDRILPREEKETSELLVEAMAKDGIKFLTESQLVAFQKESDNNFAIINCKGKELRVEFSHALFALGRKANTDGDIVRKLGLEKEKNGCLRVDSTLQTSVRGVYACGDCVGPFQFTHMAAYQAQIAVLNGIFAPWKKFKLDYSAVPWVTFTSPEVARVGMTSLEAKEKNIAHVALDLPLSANDRAQITKNTGFLKILYHPKSGKLLGVTAVGEQAGEWFSEWVLVMQQKLKISSIGDTIHSYPTLSIINSRMANIWRQKNAPQWAIKVIQYLQSWQRG